ncbi:hypothetical protein AALD74_10565 [Lachnospiraceae bacterium 48-21]
MEKQDCERKASRRLMEKLKKAFPRLPICLCADSLYACEGFFERCKEKNWRYILRYKEGSIPTIGAEYRELKKREKNYQEQIWENGKKGKCEIAPKRILVSYGFASHQKKRRCSDRTGKDEVENRE